MSPIESNQEMINVTITPVDTKHYWFLLFISDIKNKNRSVLWTVLMFKFCYLRFSMTLAMSSGWRSPIFLLKSASVKFKILEHRIVDGWSNPADCHLVISISPHTGRSGVDVIMIDITRMLSLVSTTRTGRSLYTSSSSCFTVAYHISYCLILCISHELPWNDRNAIVSSLWCICFFSDML